jgi:hypothetical protein
MIVGNTLAYPLAYVLRLRLFSATDNRQIRHFSATDERQIGLESCHIIESCHIDKCDGLAVTLLDVTGLNNVTRLKTL